MSDFPHTAFVADPDAIAGGDPTAGVIRRIATLQHGSIARWQLLQAGVTAGAIDAAIRSGRLLPWHWNGVYLAGHLATSPLTERIGAVLAYGPCAFLSRKSAAIARGVLPGWRADRIDVTVVGGTRGSRGPVDVHRARSISDDDVERVDGLPISSPKRGMLELAADLSISRHWLGRALEETVRLGLLSPADMLEYLDGPARGRVGAPRLRLALNEWRDPVLLRGEAEPVLRRLLIDAMLGDPQFNVMHFGWEVDVLYARENVVIELQSWEFHGNPRAYDRDHAKHNDLQAKGALLVGVTPHQVLTQPKIVVSWARAALEQRRWGGGRSPATR